MTAKLRALLPDTRGLAILEMAFVMPIIVILLLLIADAGLLFFNGVSATNAVREGARCGVVGYNQAAIEQRVQDASTLGDPVTITIEAFEPDGTVIVPWTSASVGDDLVVTADYEHTWIVPVSGIAGSLTNFSRTARMRIEVDTFDKTDCSAA
jgi:hypothetical protein